MCCLGSRCCDRLLLPELLLPPLLPRQQQHLAQCPHINTSRCQPAPESCQLELLLLLCEVAAHLHLLQLILQQTNQLLGSLQLSRQLSLTAAATVTASCCCCCNWGRSRLC
jgi:hypothetical protein